MSSSRIAKGQKRARLADIMDSADNPLESVASTSQVQLDTPPPKVSKPKRAVTKVCPVCKEDIPVRLLAVHAELEAARVQEILQSVGSAEVLEEAEPDDGFTARTRRSALKARRSMSSSIKVSGSSEPITSEAVDHTLRMLKRHRKRRHAKLKDLTRDDDDNIGLGGADSTVCPVCLKLIQGDSDVVEAHVDSCLAHESRLQAQRERQQVEAQANASGRDGWEEVEVDGEIRIRVTDGVTFRGTGFNIRNPFLQDVEDDIDIDGEDDILYGTAQFTESDILVVESAQDLDAVSTDHVNENVDIGMGGTTPGSLQNKSLRDLVAEGKVVVRKNEPDDLEEIVDEVMGLSEAEEIDKSIELARLSGNLSTLIAALENKIQLLESSRISSPTSLLCRICIDPYSEPTVSTGCWHTCCKECWLRCLGSTKLCPICKRITSATELRRIYL